jgi:hypothetical protein
MRASGHIMLLPAPLVIVMRTISLMLPLRVPVQGCADPESASRHMWMKRTGDDLHVKCNKSGESWYLTCSGDKWKGNMGNCSSDGGAHSTAAKRGTRIAGGGGSGRRFVVGKEVGGRALAWMSDREWVVGQQAGAGGG